MTGFVYFIKPKFRDGPIKIGSSTSLNRRIESLQTSNFEELEVIGAIERDDYKSVERELHLRFVQWRVRGEWFAASPELIEHVMNLSGLFSPLGDRIVTKSGFRWSLRDTSVMPARRVIDRAAYKFVGSR